MTVLQPYVPAYRVPFFDELARMLDDADVDLRVLHGSPEGGQAQRRDARAGRWSAPIRSRTLRLPGHALHWRPVLRKAWDSDMVIAELASTNLDTYLLALLLPKRLMLWGHGRSYVTDSSALDKRLELWLSRRARHVFVYTEGGSRYLQQNGIPADRRTVVRNSTDTTALRAMADSLTPAEIEQFRTEHGLGDGPVGAFVGSYDESKSLPLLIQASRHIHDLLPSFRLLIAGAGPLQALVDEAAGTQDWIRVMPRAETPELARIGRVASCLLLPGRVGLAAVDALALGLPVITTSWPWHAPEFEYLDGSVSLVTEQTAESFALGTSALLSDPERLAGMRAAASDRGRTFGVEQMAQAFAGVLADLGRGTDPSGT